VKTEEEFGGFEADSCIAAGYYRGLAREVSTCGRWVVCSAELGRDEVFEEAFDWGEGVGRHAGPLFVD